MRLSAYLLSLTERGPEQVKLYKYRRMASLGNERIFTKSEIYFSSARDFNDPFDCRPYLKRNYSDEEIKNYSKYLVNKKLPGLPRADRRKKAAEIKRRMRRPWELEQLYFEQMYSYGLYCLSGKFDNILMWSHYADNHQGFCLEFSGKEPQVSPFPVSWPIIYQKDRPIVDRTVTAGDIYTDEIVRPGLLTKSLDWEYEKEWRALRIEGTGPMQLPKGLLTAVILGAKMKLEDREQILSWARQHPTPLGVCRITRAPGRSLPGPSGSRYLQLQVACCDGESWR
jgi:hypothetical protein